MIDVWLEPLIRGILAGGLYALVALGMTLVFGVMRVINVAHGEFLMLGGYLAYFLWVGLGLNPLAGLVVIIPLAFAGGGLLQKGLFEGIASRPEASLSLTFGLSITLWSLAQLLFSADFRSINYMTDAVAIVGVWVNRSSVAAFLASLLLAGTTFALLQRSPWGKAMRAVAQNDALARACGVPARRVRMAAMGVGVALAAGAGGLVAMSATLFPQMGARYVGKAFAVSVLGGMGSVPGAMLGGLLLGVVEGFAVYHGSTQTADLVAYALTFFMLVLRPSGLMGRETG